MALIKPCAYCGKPFQKPPYISVTFWTKRKFCREKCYRMSTRRGGKQGAVLGVANALHLAPASRYAGRLTRDLHTLAVAELRDVRLTMEILRARGKHLGELPRHEARLSAVVARGWEVRV